MFTCQQLWHKLESLTSKKKCSCRGSNPGPSAHKTEALPTAPQEQDAPSGNRTRGTSLATRYFTTKPMALSHVRCMKLCDTYVQPQPHDKNGVRSGIRTHAPEETGALNQRLRPLGHPNTTLCKTDSVGHTFTKIGDVSKKSGLPGWTRTTDLGIAAEHFHLQSPALPTELPRGCHV